MQSMSVSQVYPDALCPYTIPFVLKHELSLRLSEESCDKLKLSMLGSNRLFSVDVMVELQLSPKKETLKISILFFILFTASNSFLTIRTFIYEQADLNALGPANIAVTYISFIISTLYAPTCPLRIKYQILIATVAYTLNFSTGLFVPMVTTNFKYALTCLGGAIAGLSAGLLWVSQGRYVHLVCELSKTSNPNLKEQCFGLFSLIYCMSHIPAGFITTVGLGLFNQQIYFIIITATGIAAILFTSFLIINVEQIQKKIKIKEEEERKALEEPFISEIERTREAKEEEVAIEAQQQVEGQQEEPGLRQVFRYYPKMSSILWILVIDGFCYGIHISQITHMIPADTPADKLNLYAGFCNIALGCGASLGGYSSGFVCSKIGGKRSGNIGIFMFIIGSLLVLASLQAQVFWLTLLSVFFWGFFLFYIEGWLFIICSREFKGRSESFSVNKQLGSIACFLFQLIVLFTNNDLNLPIVVGVGAVFFSLLAFLTLRKLPKLKKKVNSLRTTSS